jgi:hypothetical protein
MTPQANHQSTRLGWCGRRWTTVALSLDEVKYCTLMENTKQVVWLRKLMTEIGLIKPRLRIVF